MTSFWIVNIRNSNPATSKGILKMAIKWLRPLVIHHNTYIHFALQIYKDHEAKLIL